MKEKFTAIMTMIQKYKLPILVGSFLLLIIGAYYLGQENVQTITKEEKPVQISQDLLDNANVLQNKLNTSEQNVKLLQRALDKIHAGTTSPVANYYVTAPTVEKAATIVERQIAANDPTLPAAALEKTDRTVVTPIIKDAMGQTLPADQQKVDVYKINLRKDHRIKVGATVIDDKVYESVGYEQNRIEALAHLRGKDLQGATVMWTAVQW